MACGSFQKNIIGGGSFQKNTVNCRLIMYWWWFFSKKSSYGGLVYCCVCSCLVRLNGDYMQTVIIYKYVNGDYMSENSLICMFGLKFT